MPACVLRKGSARERLREGRGSEIHTRACIRLSLHRDEMGPSFSAHSLLAGPLCSKSKSREEHSRRRMAQKTRDQLVGVIDPGRAPCGCRWILLPPWPLWIRGLMPWGNTASTVECTEPPTPPRHLFSISEDGPILSTPGKQFLRNCSRRGGAPGNLPEASSTYADWPPLLRQTQQ